VTMMTHTAAARQDDGGSEYGFHWAVRTPSDIARDHGDFQAMMEERQTVPPWIGAVAVVGGIVLLITGSRRRG